ncbi:MAG: rhodanese-like domain-containing protein [Bacteroidales bacterium]|nr:rhodanese-like domain-containing protein [Bacteroidales bacterium]
MEFKNITPSELKKWIDEGRSFQLVDLRETHEFNFSHIDRAINIPGFKVLRKQLEEFKTDIPIVLYCKLGMKCMELYPIIYEINSEVYCLEGGIFQWKNEIEPCLDIYE